MKPSYCALCGAQIDEKEQRRDLTTYEKTGRQTRDICLPCNRNREAEKADAKPLASPLDALFDDAFAE